MCKYILKKNKFQLVGGVESSVCVCVCVLSFVLSLRVGRKERLVCLIIHEKLFDVA